MKTIGNIIWCLFVGFWNALAYVLLGCLWCLTIIGIPFGKQCFKLAKLMFFPFGKTIKTNFEKHPIANILWILLGGFELCLSLLSAGVIFCITIIGIPFGKQCFKNAILSLIPFGATVQ